MTSQEVTMKSAQTFSQDHRPRYRMGSVKVPFMRPDTAASKNPQTNHRAINHGTEMDFSL